MNTVLDDFAPVVGRLAEVVREHLFAGPSLSSSPARICVWEPAAISSSAALFGRRSDE